MKIFVIFLIELIVHLQTCQSIPISIESSEDSFESRESNEAVLNGFVRILVGEMDEVNADFEQMRLLSQYIRQIKNFSSDPSVDYDEIVVIKRVPFGHEIFSEISDDKAKPDSVNSESSFNNDGNEPKVSIVSNGKTGFVVLKDSSDSSSKDTHSSEDEPVYIGRQQNSRKPVSSSEEFELLWMKERAQQEASRNTDDNKTDNSFNVIEDSLKTSSTENSSEAEEIKKFEDETKAVDEFFESRYFESETRDKKKVTGSVSAEVEGIGGIDDNLSESDEEAEIAVDMQYMNAFEENDQNDRIDALGIFEDEPVQSVIGNANDNPQEVQDKIDDGEARATFKIDAVEVVVDDDLNEIDVEFENESDRKDPNEVQDPTRTNIPAIEMSGGLVTKMKNIYNYLFG